MTYSISQLSSEFGLSRGTLLYYDAIGLLKPATRMANNYRRYSEADLERLRQICLYRETGMPLDQVRQLLESAQNDRDPILEKHLAELNQSMRKLEIQRQIIVQMLSRERISEHKRAQVKERFVAVLNKAGFDDQNLARLHREFERFFPEEHQAFLEFLGIPPEEIKIIRADSRDIEI